MYRARDTRLGREVAIKTSKEQFTERFEREGRAVAALNHPNIAQLFDIGALPNGAGYMVMEYVEGTEPKGPLPIDEVLKLTVQIADALDAAHEKGITHRDLKPANIKIKPDGTVKVLDFGLAKLGQNATPGSGNPETSPTLTLHATEAGMILGTAGYMSPEQARGKHVDRRADIWAFGVVLYELLTGKKLFTGEDVVDILAAIVKTEPDVSAAPAQFHKLLTACLQKDPKQRLQAAGDWKLLLSGDGDGDAVQPMASAAGPPSRLGKLWPTAAALLALSLAALAFLHFRETPPPEQTVRALIALPENSTFQSFAISPDGRTLVIAATVNGKRQLWLRPLDALQAQPMPFTDDALYPFWSPDSRYIGFFAQGKLKKISASGGPAQSLCEARSPKGGSWNRADVIVFSPSDSGISIQRISANGGAPVDVTKTKGVQDFPTFLPGGNQVLYEARGTAETTGIYVSSLDGRENRRVLPDASGAVFAPSTQGERPGHLLFVRENTLMAAPFDPASAQVLGDVVPVADGVSLDGTYLPVAVSDNGVLLYAAGGSVGGQSQISWFDRTGKSLGLVGMPGNVHYLAISPDEKSVAFARDSSGGSDLWVRDLSRGTETRLTNDALNNNAPFWSPKGDRIVFASNRSGVYNLYQKAANGSGQDERLLPNNFPDFPTQWSRDGRFIVYRETDPKTKRDVWVLPTEGAAPGRKPIPFLRTEASEFFAQLSPDNHWMAFTSDRSGKREVYVRPFPPSEGEWTISLAGGQAPRWRGDGKELFFEAAGGKMMAVAVKAVTGPKPSFEAGAPVPLFDAHMVHSGADVNFEYDVNADGKRFLINTTGATGAASPPLTVVANWQAGLKK